MTSNATGLSAKHKGLMKYVQRMNNITLKMTNHNAAFGEIMPAGISRMMVRGFFASMSLSSHLLNAMAALLANTIHNNTNINNRIQSAFATFKYPKVNPVNAKGKAKTVWLNLMRLR